MWFPTNFTEKSIVRVQDVIKTKPKKKCKNPHAATNFRHIYEFMQKFEVDTSF